MLSSDWSSDVCSSELSRRSDAKSTRKRCFRERESYVHAGLPPAAGPTDRREVPCKLCSRPWEGQGGDGPAVRPASGSIATAARRRAGKGDSDRKSTRLNSRH